MQTQEIPKPIRRELAHIVGEAHEAVLSEALGKLAEQFDAWRTGKINPFELAQAVHEFHDGPAREIYNRYAAAPPTALRSLAAHAIAAGIIGEQSLSADTLAFLDSLIRFHREDLRE